MKRILGVFIAVFSITSFAGLDSVKAVKAVKISKVQAIAGEPCERSNPPVGCTDLGVVKRDGLQLRKVSRKSRLGLKLKDARALKSDSEK